MRSRCNITYAGTTHTGRVREKNEDNWAAKPKQGLYVVSDGMGGQFAGQLASRIVVGTLPALLGRSMSQVHDLSAPEASDRLRSALRELSDQMRQQSVGEPGLEGMGATVVLALVRDSRALIGHMGDSRAYLLRDGRLRQLTKDHSIVQLLIDSGDIHPEQAAGHPARGQLSRYVGMDGEPLPEAQHLELQGGDRLLLCTDGLHGMLSDGELQCILESAVQPDQACERLIDRANDAGGKDNITAIVMSVSSDR